MRPKVIVNLAMSTDGKIALPSKKPVRISSEEDLRRVHELRAACDAILVGVGTVIVDNPKLTVKKEYAEGRNPLRIVLDADGAIPEGSHVLDGSASTLVATNTSCTRTYPGVEMLRAGRDEVDLEELLRHLESRGVRTLLVEGGSTVIWSFLSQKLVDEVKVFVGSLVIGGYTAPTMAGGEGAKSEADLIRLSLQRVTQLGDGVLIEYAVVA